MSLFELGEVERCEELEDEAVAEALFARGIGSGHRAAVSLGKARNLVSDVVGILQPNEDLHFVTRGEWSCHHLLEYVLGQTGASNVWIACWTIGEDAARTLRNLLDSGQIRLLKAVFDLRAQQRKPEAYQLAMNVMSDMRTASCHAKVTVIEPLEVRDGIKSVVISGSANYTRNPRIEAGVISTHGNVFEMHKDWIEEILRDADPFI